MGLRHRQKMEMKMLEANIKAERAGQSFGFIIFFSALAIGATLMILGQKCR